MVISKILEKKVKLTPDDKGVEFEKPIELEYYLIESKSDDCDELKGKKVYGFEIVKRILNKESERKLIKNFSCCKKSTKDVLDKLINNTVTPVTLDFIIDDILGA